MNNSNLPFKVFGEDVWLQSIEDQFLVGRFASYDEALAKCHELLDQEFLDIVKDCPTSGDFFGYWSFHGTIFYIHPTPAGMESFNTRDYLNEKINKYYQR